MKHYVIAKALNILNKYKKQFQINKKVLLTKTIPLYSLIFFILIYFLGDRYISTDNAYTQMHIISVSSKVEGPITDVFVEDNKPYKEGEMLFRIDQRPYLIEKQNLTAKLEDVKNEISSLKAGYNQKLEEVNKAENDAIYYEKQYNRYLKMFKGSAISDYDLDSMLKNRNDAMKAKKAATESLNISRALLGGDPEIKVEEHPKYKAIKAELEKTILNLHYTNALAPFDGVAANVKIKTGEYAKVGSPLFAFVDDNSIWIEANFKETEITNFKVGNKVEIEVDNQPDFNWRGEILNITPASGAEFSILPPQNSSGNWVKVVQRIMVKIQINSEDLKNNPKLQSGLSCYVTVDTEERRIYRILKSIFYF